MLKRVLNKARKTDTDRKFKGRTIIDYVLSRQPDFDPKRHKVLVNDYVVDPNRLEDKLGPLDVVQVGEV